MRTKQAKEMGHVTLPALIITSTGISVKILFIDIF